MFLVANSNRGYSWTSLKCETGTCDVADLRWADGSRLTYTHNGIRPMDAGTAVMIYAPGNVWYFGNVINRRYYICERDDTCLSSPCQNGGTCLVNSANGDWMCECPGGTSGDNCACSDIYCENDRPCVNGASEPSCDCGEIFTGSRCELDIDECLDVNICNGGHCINSNGGFNCICPSSRQGDRCENDVNECEEHGCHSNGECTNYHGSYTCECLPGYDADKDCAPQPSSNSNNEKKVALSTDAAIAMLALGCLLAVAAVIAVFIGIIYARKWKNRMLAMSKNQVYDAPEAKATDTELYEITDNPAQDKTNHAGSQMYEDVTASAVSVAVAENDPAHIYEATEPCTLYANTSQEPNTYDKLTF